MKRILIICALVVLVLMCLLFLSKVLVAPYPGARINSVQYVNNKLIIACTGGSTTKPYSMFDRLELFATKDTLTSSDAKYYSSIEEYNSFLVLKGIVVLNSINTIYTDSSRDYVCEFDAEGISFDTDHKYYIVAASDSVRDDGIVIDSFIEITDLLLK